MIYFFLILIFLNIFLGITASGTKYDTNDIYQAWRLNSVVSSSSSSSIATEERTSNTNSFEYVHSRFLSSATSTDENVGIMLHWTINKVTNTIRLAIACLEAKGWVGIGFTEMGGMPGADMVIFEARDIKLYDAYAVAFERPQIDPHQDWTLLNSIVEEDEDEEGNRLILFEVERDLDTGDNMDHPFHDDTNLFATGTRMIAAWGDTEEMHYHGPDNRLQQDVRFFANSDVTDKEMLKTIIANEAEGSISLNVNNFNVPKGKKTWYEWECITVSDLIQYQDLPKDKALHLIGFEVELDPGSHVHHIVLYQDRTEDFTQCDPWHGPTSMVMIWNKGQSRFVSFPDDVGVLLADESSRNGEGLGIPPKSFRLEIHYENPHNTPGVIDSSGVKLHYTSNLRKYTAATLELADPQVKLFNEPIGQGLQKHTFGCPSSCTESYLPSGGVTVFYQLLHMHGKGLTMEIVHKRDGKELNVASVEYYNVAYGAQVINDEYQVLPGDTFESRCVYEGDENLQFGFEIRREMCLGTVYYYPSSLSSHMMCTVQSDVKECVSEYFTESLSSYSELNRTFGLMHQEDVDTQKEKVMMHIESQEQQQHDSTSIRNTSTEQDKFIGAEGHDKDTNVMERASLSSHVDVVQPWETVSVMSFLMLTLIIVVIRLLFTKTVSSRCRKDMKPKYAHLADNDESYNPSKNNVV